jgi:adenylate kinase family enzyme
MISHQETRDLELKIRRTPRSTLLEARKLKAILGNALSGFEKVLNALAPNEREVALSLYLERIREVSFIFHLAALKLRTKSDASEDSTAEALRARLEQYRKELEETAELYQLL